jgi:hypothetical protein
MHVKSPDQSIGSLIRYSLGMIFEGGASIARLLLGGQGYYNSNMSKTAKKFQSKSKKFQPSPPLVEKYQSGKDWKSKKRKQPKG